MFKNLFAFFKEIKSFYIFYKKINKDDRDIVFYAEDKASYCYFEGIIERLTNTENIKICYITSEINDPLFEQNDQNITPLYIKSLLFLFTITLKSKILIMTMPDLHQFHIQRSQFGTNHIYLFHNIGSSFPVIRFGALFHYDTIYCVGPHHNEEIRKQEEIYDLPKKELVDFGYFRLEKTYNDYKKFIANNKRPEIPYKAHILLGPSWGPDSILNLCGESLIETLLNLNYLVTVRPHPMTRLKDPALLDTINAKFNSFNNFIFEEDISSLNSYYHSDLLISDWSGIIYEYAFGTERPVLSIDVPQKIVNEKYKEVGIEPIDIKIRDRIGKILPPENINTIDTTITELLENKEKYVHMIQEERTKYVYNFNNSSQIGADHIKKILNACKDA